MTQPRTATFAVAGGLAACALAAAIALAPDPGPRLVVADNGSSHGGHGTYHPPVNAPYDWYVTLCVDKPGTATVTDASVVGDSPALRSFGNSSGTGDSTVRVSAVCDDGGHAAAADDHGESPATGVQTRLQLEGYSPPRKGTIIRLTYTVEGDHETHETDVSLPSLTQRQV